MGTLTARQLIEQLSTLSDEALDRTVAIHCCVGSRHPVAGIYAGSQSVSISVDESTDLDLVPGEDDDEEEIG